MDAELCARALLGEGETRQFGLGEILAETI